MEKFWKNATRVLMALAVIFVVSSCSVKEEEDRNIEVNAVNKPLDPELTFVPIVDEEPVDTADVTSKIYDHEVEYKIWAAIGMAEYDYTVAREYKELHSSYCNQPSHKNLAGLGSTDVVGTFALEDGNVATVVVNAPIPEPYAGETQPYWSVKDINISNLRNYKESGDSLWTEITAIVSYASEGVNPAQQAALTLKDSVVRVMVAEADQIIGRRYDKYRDPVSDNVEQVQIVKTNIWKSGRETAEPTVVQLLPRSLDTIVLGEQETPDFGTFVTKMPSLSVGSSMPATDVELSTNFTNLVKRVDVYQSVVENAAGNIFEPKYTMTHYGVTYSDGDTTIVFPVVDWSVAEVSNILAPTTGSIAHAEYKTMTNNVRTTYLEYVQDASETGRLYKKAQDEVTEGWDNEASWLKVVGKNVVAHGVWVRHHTIADDETITFDTTMVRDLSANTWEIYTSKKDNTTGANSVSTSRASRSHGVWSWSLVSNTITENVAFTDGVKQNIFNGKEYQNVALTYHGKKLAFRDYSVEYSQGSVSGPTANGESGDYEVFKQNTTVTATANGNQAITATAQGKILVKKQPVEPPFFPSEYGKFEKATFSATVNPHNANSWYFGCSMHFEKGTLALPIDQQGNPLWDEMSWWPGVKDAQLNGAYYIPRYGKWYPCIAADKSDGMEWSLCAAQGSYGIDMLGYASANTYGNWNFNDKNGRGQHTVLTNRFRIENDTNAGKFTLYFNGVNKGSWTYAK
jgi:hypothetical protein